MAYTGSAAQLALVQLVEFRADQITGTGQTIGVNKERIYSELEAAAKKVLQTARREIVYPAGADGTTFVNANEITVNGRLRLLLPTDFIRFLRLECENWSFPVDRVVQATSEEYRVQGNSYAQADTTRPIAALVPITSSPGYAIEPFPASASATPVTEFTYVPTTVPEDMPAALQDAMVYFAASMVLLNERRAEEAGIAQQAALDSLASIKVGAEGE